MPLSGKQFQEIQEALLDAFPSTDVLRMAVRLELNENLNEIAGGENLRILVFNLVSWAEQTGRTDELIQGVYKQNPGNETLRSLVESRRQALVSHIAAAGTSPVPTGPLPAGPTSIDIFLSYSRKDSVAMRSVQQILRNAGLSVWTDAGLEPGTPGWQDAIAEAVRQSCSLVVLLSTSANQSPWVKNELGYAQTHKKPIYPVLIEGEPANSVPINLINMQWIDGREDLAGSVEENLLPVLLKHVQRPATQSSVTDGVETQNTPTIVESPAQTMSLLKDNADLKLEVADVAQVRVRGFSGMLVLLVMVVFIAALAGLIVYYVGQHSSLAPSSAPTTAALLTVPVPESTLTLDLQPMLSSTLEPKTAAPETAASLMSPAFKAQPSPTIPSPAPTTSKIAIVTPEALGTPVLYRCIGSWIDDLNLQIKAISERPDMVKTGEYEYVIKDVFTTRDGSWDPKNIYGGIDQWARDAYLKPFGDPEYFDDAGADHHLFAAILDEDGKLLKNMDMLYWSDGFAQLGDSAYNGYVMGSTSSRYPRTKEQSGWANIVMDLGSKYVPERGEMGPWCWTPLGLSAEVMCGGGLPNLDHISTFVVWQAVAPGVKAVSSTLDRRIGTWVDDLNLQINGISNEMDSAVPAEYAYVIKDVFTTRLGSWEPSDEYGSIDQWARDAYLKPFGDPEYFEDAGADHNLFAAILDKNGSLIKNQGILYWSDGKPSDGTEKHTDGTSGWTNIVLDSGSKYEPDKGESGPWCWAPNGLSVESICGGGLPGGERISTFVVWQAVPISDIATP